MFVQVQFRSVSRPSGKQRKEDHYAQIGDVPRVDQRLDDEPIVRRLPKIRPALPSLRLPRLAFRHAPHKNVLNATPPPQRIKLLRIIHRTAKLESLADRPIVLDVRTLVDRHRVGVQQAVMVLRRWRGGLGGKIGFEHVSHRVCETARPREYDAVA
jgi:hypothetical protein